MAATKKSKVKAPLNRKTPVKAVPVKATALSKAKKGRAKADTPPSNRVSRPVKNVTKKAQPKTKAVKKIAPAAAAPKKDLVKKTVSTAPTHSQKTAHKVPTKAAPDSESKKLRFQKGDLDLFKAELLSMRDRITGQSGSMRTAALQRNDESNPEEDGTDAFMRLQTLEQVSSQHQLIANIDEALRSIDKGAYGVCDTCGELIGKQRLAVLPFAKNCIKCQSEMERVPRPGGRR